MLSMPICNVLACKERGGALNTFRYLVTDMLAASQGGLTIADVNQASGVIQVIYKVLMPSS
jgi:hypothetical protein